MLIEEPNSHFAKPVLSAGTGNLLDISLQVVKFCTNILTAGSDTDIKNVGADDSEGK